MVSSQSELSLGPVDDRTVYWVVESKVSCQFNLLSLNLEWNDSSPTVLGLASDSCRKTDLEPSHTCIISSNEPKLQLLRDVTYVTPTVYSRRFNSWTG